MKQRYLIALGSNRRHARHGSPGKVLQAAVRALTDAGIVVEHLSPTIHTAPLGPSTRRYANAAALISCVLAPPDLLLTLKRIEREFGRRRTARWAARVLDLDIALWWGGEWREPGLTIPHPAYRKRAFVLVPAAAIAPEWRDPHTGRTVRHHLATLTRPHPLP